MRSGVRRNGESYRLLGLSGELEKVVGISGSSELVLSPVRFGGIEAALLVHLDDERVQGLRLRTRITAISALTIAGLLGSTGAAWAQNYGTSHPISGTCYESGAWYVSNNIRTRKSGANSSRVQFSQTPTHGVAFYVLDYNTGVGHNVIYAPPLNTWVTLAGGNAPHQFVNVFRLESSGHQSNYSFVGSEQY